MAEPDSASRIYPLGGYLLSIVLVPVYVGLFPVYKILSGRFGSASLSLLLITATLGCLLLLFWLAWIRRRHAVAVDYTLVCAGIAICLLALAVPDPAFPAKRIHVLEYLGLSLVVRYAMSHRLGGRHLLLFSAGFTGLLGIHDEFLQAIHPDRTYGLRDMAVNIMAGSGGAAIWQGLNLLGRGRPAGAASTGLDYLTIAYLLWLFLGVAALVWPLSYYRSLPVPVWPALPLLGALLGCLLGACRWKDSGHGVRAVSAAAFALLVYPLLCRLLPVHFY